MKIVTWNCNGALRNKFENLSDFNADILVIQECEDPNQAKHDHYKSWANKYLWSGENKNKGLGIFVKNHIEIEAINWSSKYKDHHVKHFLPCLINNTFQLLNVWTSQSNSPNFGYIGQLWKYLEINKDNFQEIIIIGDLNSNKIWDEWDRWWNHSDIVQGLSELNIESLYHAFFNEEQGKESNPTFFLHRKEAKPYHIDYIFASKNLANNMTRFEIGDREKWLKISDHLPVICELNQFEKI